MKNLVLVFLLFSLSTLLFSQENKNTEMAKAVINSFQKNEYSKIIESFDQTMKTALPAEKLKLIWEDLNNKCGKYQKFTEITEEKIQNYDVRYVLCHFANMNLKMKLVFNEKNEIAGMFFVPEK